MTSNTSNNPEERIVIIAPIGQDASAMAALLGQHGLQPQICRDLSEGCKTIQAGVGSLLVTDEALEMPQLPELLALLQAQPAWSELPVIILTKAGESRLSTLLNVTATAAGSLTLLERPISSITLLRSVEVALHTRRRQYQVRDLLAEQHRQQQALRESEERFRSLVQQVKDYAIFSSDHQGRPTTWNEGVQRVLGFSQSEFLLKDIIPCIFVPEDVAAGVPERELRQAVTRGTAGGDRWMQRRDGGRFYASGVVTALRNPAGEHIGFTTVLRDITNRKQADDALAEARARLQDHAANLEQTVADRTRDLRATNEQLEAFVYSIAHDLRAPLRSVLGYSQLVLDDYSAGLPDAARQLLQRVQASSEFMDKLLLDLLAYGRTARADVELEPVEVRAAWDAALFQSASQIENSHARIDTMEPLPKVLGHQATLGQCLTNLLSNALKFVAPDVRPHVRFWAEPRGNYVRLCVQDNGIGIPADQHDRAFRVFERLHGSRYQGTGIGLSIVRKGVERMGGKVGLESEPGKGTCFWIDLPRVT